MILAHFIGKKKWQIDARSLRRVEAFPNRKRPRPGILRPAAIRRIQRRATCRSSVRAIPGPAAEPPLSYKFRACNDKRDPSGETHGTEQIALHQPGAAHAANVHAVPSVFIMLRSAAPLAGRATSTAPPTRAIDGANAIRLDQGGRSNVRVN